MPGVDKLHLEDALENSPQTRSMVALFEQDTNLLQKYINTLYDHCMKVLNAQNALAEATSSLSQHVRTYENLNFPLDKDPDSILKTTLKQFATTLDEVSSWQQACRTQLADGMMYPLNRFIEADLTEVFNLNDLYHAASNELDQSVSKFSKIPKKRESDKQTLETNEEVYSATKKFHQTALHYYANLNALQYKRKIAIIEPLLGMIHAMKSHYAVGHESLNSPELEDFISNISSSVQGVHSELGEETQKAIALIDSVEQQGQHLYYAEPLPDMPFIPPNTTQLQKAGYLFNKTKFAGMMTRWDRVYFYTLGGHLMSISKGEVAGSVVLELDNKVTAQVFDQEERRNAFQVSNGKKVLTLQALNERQMNEWISTIKNITKETSGRNVARQSSKERAKSLHADRSLSLNNEMGRKQGAAKNKGKLNRSLTSPMENYMMDTPIQFDMISPTDEDKLIREPMDGPPTRKNPFDQSGSTTNAETTKDSGSTIWEVFEARFCGSMQVAADRGESVVFETMQRIMAARAIHNLFKMCEIHLVINHQTLRIVDPSHQAVRESFLLEDVSFWTTHKENNRLLGFITRTKTDDEPPVFYCYVFETQVSAEDVCSSLAIAANIALKELVEPKTASKENKQDLVLTDLTAEQASVSPGLDDDSPQLEATQSLTFYTETAESDA